MSPPPRQIGRYEVLRRLATGGMAEILLATETGLAGLERLVVIKRLLPHVVSETKSVKMFLQEARIVARLRHPGVVQVIELGEQDGSYFIVMEYVEGSSVRELLVAAQRSGQRVSIDAACSIAVQACAAAHAAHELTDRSGDQLGIVHRDISPHNLMSTIDGHVKLLDFGIARATEEAPGQTRSNTLRGKYRYLSPEQCQSGALDRRSDVYSLGVVLWEVLTGRMAFRCDTELATMRAVVEGDIEPVHEVRPSVPAEISAVVARALSVNPEERHPTAAAFRRALLDACHAAGIEPSHDRVAAELARCCGDAHLARRAEIQDLLRTGAREQDTDPTITVPARQVVAMMSAAPADKAEPPSPPRRAVTAAALLTVMALAAVVLWRALATPVTGVPVHIGLAPVRDPERMLAEFSPLLPYLESRIGRPMALEVGRNYDDIAARLLAGELDFGLLPPTLYVKTRAQVPGLVLGPQLLHDGARGSQGVVLVETSSGLASAESLRGKRFCFADRSSTTGYHLPRAWLRRLGIDPAGDLVEIMSENHHQVLRDLNAGHCDAGATYSFNLLSAADAGVPVAGLKILGETGWIPNDAVCAAPETPAELRDAVFAALLELDPPVHLGAAVLGGGQRISGFGQVEDSAFDQLRQALSEAPLEP